MANVYAVKTGNWSDVTVWNTGALPTSADDVYSNNFTVTIDQNVTVLSIRNTSATGITAGGTFVISSTITVNATSGGFILGLVNLLTYNSSVGMTVTLNGYINCTVVNNSGADAITFNGAGTLNFTGNIQPNTSLSASNRRGINVTGSGTLNIVGNLLFGYNTLALRIAGNNCIVNITGDVGEVTLNTSTTNAQNQVISIAATCTLNVTGNVYGGGGGGSAGTIGISTASIVNITGNIFAGHQIGYGISTNTSSVINVIGGLYASRVTSYETFAVVSTSTTAINIFSGPFVCSSYGAFPIYVFRMNYLITATSYFEFRNSSTNGALFPSAPAPATRLVSPSTIIDAPAASDVRFGVVYASGSQTGTLRVPLPSQVSLGVLTDNTTGSAILTAAAIWNTQLSTMTTSGSIGERLSNVATVQTTAAQIAAF